MGCLIAEVLVELLGHALQFLLLRDTRGLATELRGEQVGIESDAAGALDDVAQSLPFLHAIYASTLHLALEPYKLRALVDGNCEIILGKDSDYVARD